MIIGSKNFTPEYAPNNENTTTVRILCPLTAILKGPSMKRLDLYKEKKLKFSEKGQIIT